MIQDYQTNMVYLAHGLSHYVSVCRNLLEALHREQIHAEFLPYTSSYKHVWARDYMPIQLEKTLVFYFEYWPDYLLGYDGYIPNVLEIIDHLHLGRIPVDFILDGGNFVKCGDKVIMTDKIFKENDWMERKELLATLEDYLQVQIVIIPWDRYEIFGHSDGMVQWIEGNRVLMNNYINTDPNFRKKLLEALTPHFVVDELEFNTPRLNKLSWAYLNFLRVKNTIFVPGLHTKEDPLALQQIQQFYPDCKVIQVQGCEELARDGGALHCVTWNVLADVNEWTKEKAFEEFDSKFSTETERLATYESINDLFKAVAITVFYGGYFLINNKTKIFPVDIEFYLYGERANDPDWMKDYNMYHYGENVPYFPKGGSLHPHRSGVDVTFENEEKEYRASFLIRAYRNGPNGKKETHPTYLREEMFGEASFSGSGLNIKWVNKASGEVADPDIKPRFRLNGKDKNADKKPWRFIKKEQ